MSYAALGNQNLREQMNTIESDVNYFKFSVGFPYGYWHVKMSVRGLVSIEYHRESLPSETDCASILHSYQDSLANYLLGEKIDLTQLPIDWFSLHGTPFQKMIWRTLMTIPYGETRSYQWLATEAGYPGAYRATGAANGKNPIPLVIPCHRVIAANGKLGGFMRGHENGLTVKAYLLNLENVVL